MTNLWPENLGEQQLDSPVSIMREQAKLLGDKTSNLVKAEVRAGSMDNGHFIYHFYIVAPTLNNYHFRLFTVEHNIDLYPLVIYIDEVLGEELDAEPMSENFLVKNIHSQMESIGRVLGGPPIGDVVAKRFIMPISSKDDFISNLRKILRSKRVQQVVGALLSQMSIEEVPIPSR